LRQQQESPPGGRIPPEPDISHPLLVQQLGGEIGEFLSVDTQEPICGPGACWNCARPRPPLLEFSRNAICKDWARRLPAACCAIPEISESSSPIVSSLN
jgi:hypothetical protein